MAARFARLVLVAWFVTALAAGAGCAGLGKQRPPAATLATPRTWSIARVGERCFTRLMDCRRQWEEPGCPAERTEYVCPRDGAGEAIERSNSPAIHGQLGGTSCWLYAYERDVPGYVRKGPARGPQSSKGARPNGRRWNPPPAVAPVAVACPLR